MRPYETLVVLGAQLGDKAPELMSKFESVIRDGGGELEADHSWGLRELAYPINKQSQGHYFLLEYIAEPSVVSELERTMRISEDVIRFMTVQQEHTGLPEERRRETPRDRDDIPLSELRSRPRGGESEGAPAAGDRVSDHEKPSQPPTATVATAAPAAAPATAGGESPTESEAEQTSPSPEAASKE